MTRDPKEHDENMEYQSEDTIRTFEIIGVQVLLCTGNHHRKLAILDRKIHEVMDIQILINYSNYFMEHLKNLLLEGSNPLQNASLFGLVFKESFIYKELINRTPRLAPLFMLNERCKETKSLTVTRLVSYMTG